MGSLLDWEENIFLGLKSLYQRFIERPRHREITAVRARLDPLRQELFLLARMVAGRPVSIIETPQLVLCDESHLFLPPEFSAAHSVATNEALFRLKTLLGALALRATGVPLQGRPISEQISFWTAEFPDLPASLETIQPLRNGIDLWSLLGEPRSGGGQEEKTRGNESAAGDNPSESPGEVTEIEGRGQIGVKSMEDPGDQPVEADMPIHTFEKAETLEEYTGLDRKTDDDDELAAHEEALCSLNMTQVMRSRERPRSIYRADVVMENCALEVEDGASGYGLPYPEWDFKKRRHKADWCFVRQNIVREVVPEWATNTARKHRAVILDLRKKLAALATRTERLKRQSHGPELDIDAVVRARIDLHAGHTPDERLYIQPRRRRHDMAALILMDRSFSTDSWIDDTRVLDSLRETLFCAGEVIDEFIESFAVAGFSSDTRRRCDFDLIKDFPEPWQVCRGRLGAIEAKGYTRIGPALRHAQEHLIRQPAERKIIFLFTDGRPCDYDRYEGEYGIHDVRKAIETGMRHRIRTHAFAIEKRAREHFPRMFKRNDYDIVPKPHALTAALCGAFARFKHQE